MKAPSKTETAEETYVRTTPASRALYEEACRVMPGGTTRTTVYFAPYPLYIERGQGAHVWDVDGTPRLDYIGNYSALILGHAHPRVTAAVAAQLERGTSVAAANPVEVQLAELLCERIPSLEMVRFTNSGTEATMFAMRLARVYTGRPKIARFEGGYHGTHDFAEISTKPDLALAGPASEPRPVPDSAGTPASALAETLVLPYNDADGVARILRRHQREVAGVIVEPVLGAGGVIPAEPGFLEALRAVTRELGMLLIFDEVISLRLAPGGAQQLYGVTPDLTTMAKIIGGGLPVGAFGGRADVMELLDPRRPDGIPHGGTYNGAPLGMAAGLATLRELTPEVYADLNAKGDSVRSRLRQVFDAHDIAAQVTGAGSLFNIHFTAVPVRDHRTMRTSNPRMLRDLFLGLINHGILMAPRAMGAICTPMTDADLGLLVAAVDEVVSERETEWRELGA
ncbi:MAG TPA: aspartate aminotransferase family protein [Candidatus Limnocylindrales bacterium]|nr:aspartate aminotransferase family protein [Candidatus Limnocylindrales bacterium]